MLPGDQALAAFGTPHEHGFLHNCAAAPAQRGLINMYDLANTGDAVVQSGYNEVVSDLSRTPFVKHSCSCSDLLSRGDSTVLYDVVWGRAVAVKCAWVQSI